MSAELAEGEQRTMELLEHNRLLKDTMDSLKTQCLAMVIAKNEKITALQLEFEREMDLRADSDKMIEVQSAKLPLLTLAGVSRNVTG